ncbi:MAG: DNA repair protein RecO [Erysipelotrichaceae bacterium]
MNDRIDGIVVNQIDYKENDQIITVVSKDYGKLSLYVKGFKKINSKNSSACQLLDYSSFLLDYYPHKNIQILKSASLIEQYQSIKQDYQKIAISSLMCEISSQTDNANDFAVLKQSLDLLTATEQPYLVLNLFLAQHLRQLGIAPYVDGCVICNRNNRIETISINDGGFLCSDCNDNQIEKISLDFLKKFRYINKATLDKYDKLLQLDLDDFKLTDMLVDIMVNYSGISLKSYRLLTNINF